MSDLSQPLALIREETEKRSAAKERVIIAIDGRCASGKSTLGRALAKELGCVLIHMDDFFLRPEQRTPERLAQAGENVDHGRFLEEVLSPLAQGVSFTYRPWECHRQDFGEPITVEPAKTAIVEGSYACHPDLWDYYDLRIFLTVDRETQLDRIAVRNGKEGLAAFKEKWIPLEERYFEAYDLAARCDIVIDNR